MDPSSASLKDKVAVITGGGAGIGRGIAVTFAKFGAHVVIADRDEAAGGKVAAEVRALGRKALAVTTDIRNYGQVKAMVAQTVRDLGGVDILVNNAGGTRRQSFLEQGEEGWRKHIELNFMGQFYCTEQAVKAMLAGKRGGSVIFITSIEGHRAAPLRAVYSACKAGLANFTRSLALELGEHGIRVNCVAPDFVETPHTAASLTPENRPTLMRRFPIKRVGQPEDIAGACVYLASDLGAYTTGVTLHVDGGTMASSGWLSDGKGGWSLQP
ncbi:MAG: SDR family oxidoreductase [Chloroflexi bacterium]|nr:SDR family oxidoreductase [Chloroflexota bacterium]